MIKVVAVTGYKPYELGIYDMRHPGIPYIKKTIEQRLVQLIEEGLEWVILSGQPGVELWAGEVTVALKKIYPNIQLGVMTPFFNQDERWGEQTKSQYEKLLASADFVDAITKRPYENPAQLRLKNDFFIEKSDALLILYDEEKPGSPDYYLQAAQRKAAKILYISPEEVENVARDVLEVDPVYWSQE